LSLKAPADKAEGLAEEGDQPKKTVPEQPSHGDALEESGPPALLPYQPSEQIPADQAVDFPADI
jgi:hypothetical protein